ncbi:MAG: nucleoside deaminase [Magnetococcales bacterium]|nr:nucleoside deaminase [Magnetococcales bacterium]
MSTLLPVDRACMVLALVAAAESGCRDEVPVGAVLRDVQGRVIAAAGNQPIRNHDPVGHAEIRVLQQAGHRIGNYRLTDAVMMVTLAPCQLCRQALRLARIRRVIYGSEALEQKTKRPEGGLIFKRLQPFSKNSDSVLRFFFEQKRKS